MQNIIHDCVTFGEVVVSGVLYRYRFGEVRRYIAETNTWSLVARRVSGNWEVY